MRIPVVLLAGKPPQRDEVLEYADVDNKVLIQYQNTTLLQIAVEAVVGAKIASKIILVGISESELPFNPKDYPIPILLHDIQGKQFDKIYEGAKFVLDHNDQDEEVSHILYMSSDMPHLHSSVITNYLDLVKNRGEADFYYSIVPEEVVMRDFPSFDWGYMKIKDGKFVSGNLTYIRPEKILEKYEMIKFLSENRKSFIWGVLKASPWMFLKLIFGRITLSDAEKLMTSYFGISSKLIVCQNYELSFDIDRVEDIDFLRDLENSLN